MRSFHVGSDCYDAAAYTAAIMSARAVFDMAESAGFHFNLLDIGGGFPGNPSAKPSFEEVRYAYFYLTYNKCANVNVITEVKHISVFLSCKAINLKHKISKLYL